MSNIIKNGQRWISEGEPELGLGTIIDVNNGKIKIQFSTSNVIRQYSSINAPIKRINFKTGDNLVDKNGVTFIVDNIFVKNGLIFYKNEENEFCETELADTISLDNPIERLLSFNFDTIEAFNLRYNALILQDRRLKSTYRGFYSARIDLIPHQLFIANEVSERYLPRIMLSDQVGLGKTIEAGLIIKRLYLTNRIKMVLIIVPEHLILQWYCELFHRFNITSSIIDEKLYISRQKENKDFDPFIENHICICSNAVLNSNKKILQMSLSTDWDMVVIDEAHNILEASKEYKYFKDLSLLSKGLMLLTAIPEYANLENFFALLHLIDPTLYDKYEHFFWKIDKYTFVANLSSKIIKNKKLNSEQILFLKENLPDEYNKNEIIVNDEVKLNKKNRKIILDYLIDQHGLGRIVFRNTRKNIAIFPERNVNLIPLSIPQLKPQLKPQHLNEQANNITVTLHKKFENEFKYDIDNSEIKPAYNFDNDIRVKWLLSFLKERNNEKTLLICTSRDKVEALKRGLLSNNFKDFTYFHEDCEFIERDKRVHNFSQREELVLLLSSEIGSEGRNFQFCKNLIFFDIPFNPGLIEQRIGRLDRIGQKNLINIYIPYLENSPQAVLINWFHEGLNIFNEFKGSHNQIFSIYSNLIKNIALNKNYESNDSNELQNIILDTKKEYKEIIKKNEKGKDKLIELNSFNKDKAKEIIQNILSEDKNVDLENYIINFFEYLDFNHELLDKRTYVLAPAGINIESFPYINNEGLTVTFDRNTANSREDYTFITIDHYLVDRAIDLIVTKNTGSCSFVIWPGNQNKDLLFEIIYILECVAPTELNVDRYLSVTPVRILLNQNFEELSENISFESINDEVMEYDENEYSKIQKLIKKNSKKMFDKAKIHAEKKVFLLKENAVKKMKQILKKEIIRLEVLKRVNENIKDEEIKQAKYELSMLEKYILSARLRMDSIRIIWKI